MHVEKINGRHLLCGALLPMEAVAVGQTWAPGDGSSDSTVVVVEVTPDGQVYYEGEAEQPAHEKDNFAFQCRYCLVLDPLTTIPTTNT